jgi:hypothetical protein
MTPFVPFDPVLQMIAAFLIFIAGFLALFLFTVGCFVIAELAYGGVGLVRAYTVKINSLDDGPASIVKDKALWSWRLRFIFRH